MCDVRIVECPVCRGDGGHEVLTGMNINDGSPTGYLVACEACEGEWLDRRGGPAPANDADLDQLEAEGINDGLCE
jgi:hypothetical protein